MTTVDWIVLAVVALFALGGLRRGLLVGALSLGGFVAGAYLGARVAPQFLSQGASRYLPLAALGGGAVGAVLLRSLGGMAGGALRSGLHLVPPLRALDTLGGAVLGAATGLALAWAAGAVALYVPGQTTLRRDVQQSAILARLNAEVPPQRVIDALARVDPFAALAGPPAAVPAPDSAIAGAAGVRAAREGVVRVTGVACGLGVEGSGWIARPGTVVTNAHVVAGVGSPRVDRSGGTALPATLVYLDTTNDVAVLRVAGLRGRPLALAEPGRGSAGALLGFPGNGPYAATPVRVGPTAPVVMRDAYGRGPALRTVTTLRGLIRPGNSGGPVVDASGRALAVVFARRAGTEGGFAVPAAIVQRALARAGTRAVPSGPCAAS